MVNTSILKIWIFFCQLTVIDQTLFFLLLFFCRAELTALAVSWTRLISKPAQDWSGPLYVPPSLYTIAHLIQAKYACWYWHRILEVTFTLPVSHYLFGTRLWRSMRPLVGLFQGYRCWQRGLLSLTRMGSNTLNPNGHNWLTEMLTWNTTWRLK